MSIPFHLSHRVLDEYSPGGCVAGGAWMVGARRILGLRVACAADGAQEGLAAHQLAGAV